MTTKFEQMINLKSYLTILLLIACRLSLCAYDFAQKAPSGQMLYYNIIQDDTVPCLVEITACPSNKSYDGNIIIPDTLRYNDKLYFVTSIAPHAFTKSERLTAIELPQTLVSIGSNAFRDCIRLQSITFPEHLTYIGSYSLVNCICLKSIGIPQYVNFIGTFAFGNCKNLHNIYVDMENKYYSTIAGILFDKSGKELIHYPATRDGEHFDIPGFVNFIADWAFCGARNLKEVTIPESVVSIGRSAFWGCRLLSHIEIPNTVDVIKIYTFYDCKNLTSARVSKSTKIINEAFPPFTKIQYTPKRENDKDKPKIKRRERIDKRPLQLSDAIYAMYELSSDNAKKQEHTHHGNHKKTHNRFAKNTEKATAGHNLTEIEINADTISNITNATLDYIFRDTIYVTQTSSSDTIRITDSIITPQSWIKK